MEILVSGLYCLRDFSSLMHLSLSPALALPQGRGFEHPNSNHAVQSTKYKQGHKSAFLLPDDVVIR